MTCKLFYQSVYPSNCNISKYGEGCEQCVGLISANQNLFIVFGLIFVTLGVLYLVIRLRGIKK